MDLRTQCASVKRIKRAVGAQWVKAMLVPIPCQQGRLARKGSDRPYCDPFHRLTTFRNNGGGSGQQRRCAAGPACGWQQRRAGGHRACRAPQALCCCR